MDVIGFAVRELRWERKLEKKVEFLTAPGFAVWET